MEQNKEIKKSQPKGKETPPFFRSWFGWYAVVFVFLAILIILFYWFSITYSG